MELAALCVGAPAAQHVDDIFQKTLFTGKYSVSGNAYTESEDASDAGEDGQSSELEELTCVDLLSEVSCYSDESDPDSDSLSNYC